MEIFELRENKEKYQFLRELNIDEIIAETKESDCLYLSSIFQNHQKDHFEKNDFTKSSAFLLLNDVTSMGLDVKEFSLSFNPLWSSPQGRTAVIDDFSNDDLDIFKELINKTNNLVLKARLSDVVWQRTKHSAFAEIAIDSYFNYSKELIETDDKIWVYQPLERSILISNNIKDESRINEIVKYLESWILSNKENEDNILIDKFAKLLVHFKYGELSNLAKILENLAELSESKKNFYMAVQRWDLISEIWQKLNNLDLKKIADLRAVEALRKDSKLNESQGNYFNAPSLLSQAYQRLKQIGGTDELRKDVNDELVILQASSRKYMQTISHEFDITEFVNQAKNFVQNKVKKEALISFALSININQLESLTKTVQKNINDFPFLNLFNHSVIDRRGRTIGKIPSMYINNNSEDTDLTNKIIQTAAQNDDLLVSCYITPMFRIITNEHYIDYEILKEILSFNPVVPQDTIDIFQNAFHYCFNNDFVIGMSLLIPQVEHVIKNILNDNGLNISTFNRNAEIQEDRSFKDLIHTYKEQLNFILDENMVFEINHVFNEKISFNLRNEFAHGNMNTQSFYSSGSIYGFWLIWRLCVIGHLYTNKMTIDKENEIE